MFIACDALELVIEHALVALLSQAACIDYILLLLQGSPAALELP
jgi:hypothetical protein